MGIQERQELADFFRRAKNPTEGVGIFLANKLASSNWFNGAVPDLRPIKASKAMSEMLSLTGYSTQQELGIPCCCREQTPEEACRLTIARGQSSNRRNEPATSGRVVTVMDQPSLTLISISNCSGQVASFPSVVPPSLGRIKNPTVDWVTHKYRPPFTGTSALAGVVAQSAMTANEIFCTRSRSMAFASIDWLVGCAGSMTK